MFSIGKPTKLLILPQWCAGVLQGVSEHWHPSWVWFQLQQSKLLTTPTGFLTRQGKLTCWLTNALANFLLTAIANNQPCCSLTCDPACHDLNVFNLLLFWRTSQANVGYLKHLRYIFEPMFSPSCCSISFEIPLRKWYALFRQPWWTAWHLPACICPKSVKVTDCREWRIALKSF